MKTNAIAMGALTLLLLGGCKNQMTSSNENASRESQSVATKAASSPEELGTMGAEIRSHPSEAKKILADRGMTEESFEKAIRDVSSDPSLSRRYAAAYKKAKS